MDNGWHDGQARELAGAAWRKSRRSNPSGNCVELARLPSGQVAVRNSRHPAGPVLVCASAALAAFVRYVKDGHFDGLLAAGPDRAGMDTENSFTGR